MGEILPDAQKESKRESEQSLTTQSTHNINSFRGL